MSSNRGVFEHRVNGLLVVCYASRLETLHVLSNTHELPGHAELLLDRIEWRDGGGTVAFTVEVEGKESGDVLDQTEDFVPANYEFAIDNVSTLSINIADLFTIVIGTDKAGSFIPVVDRNRRRCVIVG